MAFTKAGIRSELERLNRDVSGQRTWGQAYGAIDLAQQSAMANVEQDYAASMNQAYQTALQNKAAIGASNVGTGYKTEAIASIDEALASAYDTYLQNYLQNQANVASTYGQYKSQVAGTVEEQADYVQRYEQAHYDYLKKLYEMHQSGDLASEGYYDPFEQINWKRYLRTSTDEAGNAIEEGLLDENALRARFFDNEDNLTQEGIDFYEQMEQDMLQRNSDTRAYTMQDFLRGSKDYADLTDWTTGQYKFSYNPDKYGDTSGQTMFNTLFGRMSDDAAYSFAERKFGMDEGTLKREYSSFESKALETRQLIDDRADYKDVSKSIDGLLEEFRTLADNFGYSTEQFEQFEDAMNQVKQTYQSYRDTSIGNSAKTGVGAGFGSMLAGLGIGSAGGPVGAVVGALAGLIVGSMAGSATSKTVDTEASIRNAARDTFNQAIVAFMPQ